MPMIGKRAFRPGMPLLSPPNEADREWLVANLDEELLWDEEVKFYRSDPGVYLSTAAVDSLIKRDFAPLVQRMGSVAARERAAIGKLEQARRNLKAAATSKVAVDIALEQMPATIGFFRNDVPLAFASVPAGDGEAELSGRQ